MDTTHQRRAGQEKDEVNRSRIGEAGGRGSPPGATSRCHRIAPFNPTVEVDYAL